MDESFAEGIKKLAEASAGKETPASATGIEEDKDFLRAIEGFYAVARRAVTIYNEASPGLKLSLNRLTPEFLDLLLNIPGRRGGFSIISPGGIVILFDEDPDTLTVIGKKRKPKGRELSRAVNLIKVDFIRVGETVQYRDNTGGRVEPEALVTLFIKWLTS